MAGDENSMGHVKMIYKPSTQRLPERTRTDTQSTMNLRLQKLMPTSSMPKYFPKFQKMLWTVKTICWENKFREKICKNNQKFFSLKCMSHILATLLNIYKLYSHSLSIKRQNFQIISSVDLFPSPSSYQRALLSGSDGSHWFLLYSHFYS